MASFEQNGAARARLEALAREMAAAASCCAPLREKAEAWLADGTRTSAEALLVEIEADVTTVDELIAMMGSETARARLGAETADALLAHGKELKAQGAAFCDCPACAAGRAILAERDALLA